MKRLEPSDVIAPAQKVGIAEYAVVTDQTMLVTSGLGSCLGIVLHDAENEISGLIHVMLPTEATARDSNPAKFVDTGVPLLIEEMRAVGADPRALRAWVVGGSEMINFSSNKESIGSRNIRAAERIFRQYDLDVVGSDVGGGHGRSIKFDPRTQTVAIRTADERTRTI